MPTLPIGDLQNAAKGEDSKTVRQRVINARKIQLDRQGKANHELSPGEIDIYAVLGDKEKTLLTTAQSRLNLSARSYHRILRVARTISDLEAEDKISTKSLAEALSYRG